MTMKTTRRAILAGAAALPALAVPALADETPPKGGALKAIDEFDTDRELLALERELETALAKTQAYMEGPYKEANDRYEKLCPSSKRRYSPTKMPAKLAKLLPPSPDGMRRYLTWGEYSMLAKFVPRHPVVIWEKQMLKKSRAESRAYRKKADPALKDSGLAAAEKEHGRLSDQHWAVFNKIMKVRAQSPEGMAVKLRAAQMMEIDDDGNGSGIGDVWKSLRTDILSVTSRGA